jgi:hypothetical protein
MNIYLLRPPYRGREDDDDPWDKTLGMVIVARSEEEARSLASSTSRFSDEGRWKSLSNGYGREGPEPWKTASCLKIGTTRMRKPKVVLTNNRGA